MTRLVVVAGQPMVATVVREGFRRSGPPEGLGGDVVPVERARPMVWLGFWKATIEGAGGAFGIADTVEEACDDAARMAERPSRVARADGMVPSGIVPMGIVQEVAAA